MDIILNLTIRAVHYELSTHILQAGKHVYSEKSLELTLDEVKRLRDIAQSQQSIGSTPDTFPGDSSGG